MCVPKTQPNFSDTITVILGVQIVEAKIGIGEPIWTRWLPMATFKFKHPQGQARALLLVPQLNYSVLQG